MGRISSGSATGGFLAGCLSLIVIWVVLGVVTYALLAPVVPVVLRGGLAVVSALLLTLGLSSFWSLARGEQGGDKSLAALIRRARTGEAPQDGEPAVAEGVVRSLHSPLTAPLSGVACAAYWYKLYYIGRLPGSARRVQVPVYWGYACRPFAIDSPVSRLRIFAVPLPRHAAESRLGPEVAERALRLVETTSFERVAALPLESVFQMAGDVFSDEDGEARRDWKKADDERDPKTLLFEETLLPVGALASAHGVWSAERGAIVSQGALGTAVSITLGGPENLRGAPGLGHSTRAYLVSATLLTALGAGLVWLSRSKLPTLLLLALGAVGRLQP
jgi:hypothetical protein